MTYNVFSGTLNPTHSINVDDAMFSYNRPYGIGVVLKQ